MLLAVAVFILLFLVVDVALNGLFGDMLKSNIGYTFAQFALRHKFTILFGGLFIIMVVVWYVSQIKLSKDMSRLMESIDSVFQKDEKLIELPNGLQDIEKKLNAIKLENIRSEQLIREEEQRKNDLIVYLAHDLKTPLTSVMGYLTLLHDETGISLELQQKYIGISLSKAKRLESLINEFFEITRFNLQSQPLDRRDINLSLMLTQLVDEFYPLLSQKMLSCRLDVSKDLHVWADPDKFARVLENLLRNAAAYSYDGTELLIRAFQNGPEITISFFNRGDRIPEEKLSLVFEKFYRLDDARQSSTGGAGLGLAIAKEIVGLHQGRIFAQSNENQTSFTVLLPAKPVSLDNSGKNIV